MVRKLGTGRNHKMGRLAKKSFWVGELILGDYIIVNYIDTKLNVSIRHFRKCQYLTRQFRYRKHTIFLGKPILLLLSILFGIGALW